MSKTQTRSASCNRAGLRTGSPANGTRAARSPSSVLQRDLDRIAVNSINGDFGEETSPSSAGILHVRLATLAAAERLQTALGQTSYVNEFASFVSPTIMQQMTLRMKAMKKLLEGHPEFKSGATLKRS